MYWILDNKWRSLTLSISNLVVTDVCNINVDLYYTDYVWYINLTLTSVQYQNFVLLINDKHKVYDFFQQLLNEV